MAELSSQSSRRTSDHIRILVHIEQDAEGFPGVAVESLWCVPDGEYFRIDNIPFYAPGLACGDIISARHVDGELWADSIVGESGHATLWVVCSSSVAVQELRLTIAQLGCASELSNNPRFVSVDVPPDADRVAVRALLVDGENSQKWEFAESVRL